MSGLDTLPSALTPVEFMPMGEVTTNADLRHGLIRAFEDDIPGFIIRASGLIDIGAVSHEEITQAVIDSLNEIDKQARYAIGGIKNPDGSYSSLTIDGPDTASRVGNLHFDARRTGGHFNVHTTEEGTGGVMLFEGRDIDPTSKRYNAQLQRQADQNLRRGFINSRILGSEKIHKAKINTGDTVVFPFTKINKSNVNTVRPVWHRFDTTTQRRSRAAEIVRTDK